MASKLEEVLGQEVVAITTGVPQSNGSTGRGIILLESPRRAGERLAREIGDDATALPQAWEVWKPKMRTIVTRDNNGNIISVRPVKE